jgi:hypothetical protein
MQVSIHNPRLTSGLPIDGRESLDKSRPFFATADTLHAGAAIVIHELNVHVHYLSCESGVGWIGGFSEMLLLLAERPCYDARAGSFLGLTKRS